VSWERNCLIVKEWLHCIYPRLWGVTNIHGSVQGWRTDQLRLTGLSPKLKSPLSLS
jgi:hypothetical protein